LRWRKQPPEPNLPTFLNIMSKTYLNPMQTK
jgi:hypothetical protein